MKTTILNRTNEATNQPAVSAAGQHVTHRVANARQPVAQSQLDRASMLGHRFDAIDVQPKLTLGPADDHYEREADRVAGHVVAAMDSPTQATATPQITPVAGTPAVQRAAAGGSTDAAPASSAGPGQASVEASSGAQGGPVSAVVAQGIEAARGAGSPLPVAIRQPAERVLGADLSGVRVHTTGQADRLSRQLHADAFTQGKDLFFRHETFSPNSPEGQQLIAHELTHVAQQRQQAKSMIQRGKGKKKNMGQAPTGRKTNRSGHHDPAKTPGKARPKARLKEFAAKNEAQWKARASGTRRDEWREVGRAAKAAHRK